MSPRVRLKTYADIRRENEACKRFILETLRLGGALSTREICDLAYKYKVRSPITELPYSSAVIRGAMWTLLDEGKVELDENRRIILKV